jgi:type IV pilus assembly protein PilA
MNRKGFTLIELLIVIVIIGVLAAIAIPKFSQTKGKAQKSSGIADLRNLATAQEAYFADNNSYASTADIVSTAPNPADPTKLVFSFSKGNTVNGAPTVTGTATSWKATLKNGANKDCAIYFNEAPAAPATEDGVAACAE